MHACVCVWHETGGYACQRGVYAAGKSLCSINNNKKTSEMFQKFERVRLLSGTPSVFIYILVLALSTAGKWHNDVCWKKPEDKNNTEFFVIKSYRIAMKKGISFQPAACWELGEIHRLIAVAELLTPSMTPIFLRLCSSDDPPLRLAGEADWMGWGSDPGRSLLASWLL